MKPIELAPFKGYLSSTQSTTVQTVSIVNTETIELIYDAVYQQLAITNKTDYLWALTANIEFWNGSSGDITTYPIEFTIPSNYHVYLNAQTPLDPNPLLEVKTLNTSCFVKDLSIVSELLKTSLQWEANLKRMPNNENRLLLQGDQLSTVPA